VILLGLMWLANVGIVQPHERGGGFAEHSDVHAAGDRLVEPRQGAGAFAGSDNLLNVRASRMCGVEFFNRQLAKADDRRG
jgi:hypothetical protein